MIISASYKTDIPTFYGEWFMNRLHAGFCKMINPYGGQIYTIDLSPEQVDGFVFWTKNIGPFLQYLPEIQRLGYPFLIQHTINGYPVELETRVINPTHTLNAMQQLAQEYGSPRLIWRYDPILFTSLTPPDWHRSNFAKLATELEGVTDEVVISFAQIYRKAERNLRESAQQSGFTWHEHNPEDPDFMVTARALAADLAQIAASHGMQLRVCSQKAFLVPGLIEEASCINAERLERVAGHPLLSKARQKGNRKECACAASKDIGAYDTCPHGCVYCYAVQRRDVALQRYKEHDLLGEFLFSPVGLPVEDKQPFSAVIPITEVHKETPHMHNNLKSSEIDVVQKKLF